MCPGRAFKDISGCSGPVIISGVVDPDFSRAARKPSERLAIVQYVLDGGSGTIETDWIEWKSEFDLQQVKYRAASAKHILGFANRHPDRAQRHAEGLAYLLIGLEPGRLVGVPEIWDPEKLESWITPYVGQDVVWDPNYVEISGQHVLFVTVEAPRWGDPPHPLRKESSDELDKPMRNGWVYVRKPGKTEQATAEDLQMLIERARSATRSLSVDVELAGDQPKAMQTEWFDDGKRDAAIAESREKLLRGVPTTRSIFDLHSETRQPDAFPKQVESYLKEVRRRWNVVVAIEAIERAYSPLKLWIRNDTDTVYEGVQVEATIPLDPTWVHSGAAAARRRFSPPEPPPSWGDQVRALSASIGRNLEFPGGPEFENEEASDDKPAYVKVRFQPILVRPRSVHPLAELYLTMPPPLAGAELPIRWRATSSNTPGEARGNLTVPVASDATP